MDRRYIHVINYEKKPCLISAEISALFWDSDLLRSMVCENPQSIIVYLLSETWGPIERNYSCFFMVL